MKTLAAMFLLLFLTATAHAQTPRACEDSDIEKLNNVLNDLDADAAQAQLQIKTGLVNKHDKATYSGYLDLAQQWTQFAIDECDRTTSTIDFVSCKNAAVLNVFQTLTATCNQMRSQVRDLQQSRLGLPNPP